jgi:hypothetical protein
MKTDKNYEAFPDQLGQDQLRLSPANWRPPVDPMQYDDIVKMSNKHGCIISYIGIRGGREDCIDAVRGSDLTIRGCTLNPLGDGAVTVKGAFDGVTIQDCTIFAGNKRTLEFGQFDNYWYPGRPPTRRIIIKDCCGGSVPIDVTLWDADYPLVIDSDVRVKKVPKYIWFPYFCLMYVYVRLCGAKTK